MNRLRSRKALIIGNAEYGQGASLSCPPHDTDAMYATLKALNFDVAPPKLDLTFDETNATIQAFVDVLRETPTDVALFYYSGHGLLVDNEVCVVPVDIDRSVGANPVKLVSVQAIIENIAAHSAARIILLDACRRTADIAVGLDKSKSVYLATRKAFYLANEVNPVIGMNEVKAARDTFISYAAAAGDAAYEGDHLLSPFTEAFVKHMSAVDVPLSNLAIRVRQEVYEITGGAQKTWDQSSLNVPFFFNPGAQLLLMGNNQIGFMGLLSSIGLLVLVARSEAKVA